MQGRLRERRRGEGEGVKVYLLNGLNLLQIMNKLQKYLLMNEHILQVHAGIYNKLTRVVKKI